ncbi:MAG TPA: DUF1343 domain-containing protein [Bacteroidales bacterium]|nr:DUF1343 domain-containing protein [Bacteroidales bacterium]
MMKHSALGLQKLIFIICFLSLILNSLKGQDKKTIVPAAERTHLYFPLLEGKNIAIVANHTSLIGEQHLVDSLLNADFNIMKVFSPEHGFRGNADAGQNINDAIDPVTGLAIISLYGKNKKPDQQSLENIDLVIFDIQDVGARFYTYISTMTYVMEACAESGIPILLLDRPNPNGFYVDGPVLEKKFSSFVGMHPVPVVHGMTTGEYALMVKGEGWLKTSNDCQLTVIPVDNYSHSDFYELPVAPSPNLRNKYAIYLYPSICLFEGTVVSVGRGTNQPFQIIGHPDYTKGSFVFTPNPGPGAANPPYCGIPCYGINLTGYAREMSSNPPQLHIEWLLNFYHQLSGKTDFFNDYFEKLAGTDKLRKQIIQGLTADEIRANWQSELKAFKKIRKKYLLYDDFE